MLSVIMPIRDALESVRICLGSLLRYTDMKNVELIVIDDGSKPETADYLKQFVKNIKDGILIGHNISHGWCHCINKGVQHSHGEYIVFANSDIGFTPQWAEKLQGYIDNNENLGLIGPVTDNATSEQKIDIRDLSTAKGLIYTKWLMFFCVMLKRKIYQEIGELDERFGLGGQDDADYCIRVHQAGYKVGIAQNVFIKHFGSSSFKELFDNDIPKSQKYAESRQKILQEKYGLDKTNLFKNKDIISPKRTTGNSRLRIFIAVPNNWTISSELAMRLLQWLALGKYDLYITMPMGLFPLDNARNSAVKDFRELDYDYLFWIDADVVPPINALDRLLAADKDIIGAVAFAIKTDNGEHFPYPVTLRYNEDRQFILYFGKGVERVDAMGGACVLVKRDVYEKMERPYEFSYHADGTMALDCDFRFYQKAADIGYTIWVDFDIRCDHQRVCSIKGLQDQMGKIKSQCNQYKNELELLKQKIT